MFWNGPVPLGVPANSFISVRMVGAGRSICLTGGSCTRFIRAESQEFITYNDNSSVTSLPNGGIRTIVPTPAPPPNTTRITSTILRTITASFTGFYCSIISMGWQDRNYHINTRAKHIKQNFNHRGSNRWCRRPFAWDFGCRVSNIFLQSSSKGKKPAMHRSTNFRASCDSTTVQRRAFANRACFSCFRTSGLCIGRNSIAEYLANWRSHKCCARITCALDGRNKIWADQSWRGSRDKTNCNTGVPSESK